MRCERGEEVGGFGEMSPLSDRVEEPGRLDDFDAGDMARGVHFRCPRL